MSHPTPKRTEGLVGERPELKERSLSQSRGDEATRTDDTKHENSLRDSYVEAEAVLDRTLRAHRGGQATIVDVQKANEKVREAWARYYKAKTGKKLRKSVEAEFFVSENELEIVARGNPELAAELPDMLIKAARRLKGDDDSVQIFEPGFFSNRHLQSLYLIRVKKGLQFIRKIEKLIEAAMKGVKVKDKITMKKSHDDLEKAFKPLTPMQIQQLVDEVNDQAIAFSVNWLGWKPPKTALARLKKKGLIQKQSFSFPGNAYAFQRVVDVLESAGKDAGKVTFKKMLEMAHKVPLTRFEKDQIAYAENKAARHVTGLAEGINRHVEAAADEAAQIQQYRSFIRETSREGLLNRWSWKDLSSELGRRTGDWARDWDRISRSELQNATLHASASKIARDNKDEDPLVYKMPRRDACRYCIELYLQDGDFEKPRIFHLSTLAANGTNVGRKVADWKPTIDIAHPNCNCSLQEHVGELRGEIKEGPMGDLQAEETHLYAQVTPKDPDSELAKKLMALEVRLDGVPIKELTA